MYVDQRLAGIQAVQTLSRLNRAHPGKDTTYVLDFVNSAEEVLRAFKTYYETAELRDVTDPNIVLNLQAKLDAAGSLRRFRGRSRRRRRVEPEGQARRTLRGPRAGRGSAREALQGGSGAKLAGDAANDEKAAQEAPATNSTRCFCSRATWARFSVSTAFLSQIFDYGNTAIEKRFVFFRRLLPAARIWSRARRHRPVEGQLTHHGLKNQGKPHTAAGEGEAPKLAPITEAGSGTVQRKGKGPARGDHRTGQRPVRGRIDRRRQLVYVNNVIKGKLLESEELVKQAANNTKEQFANSPTLSQEILNAIMDALAAHSTMSKQALDSERVREGLKDVLLGPAQLYEALREKAGQQQPA